VLCSLVPSVVTMAIIPSVFELGQWRFGIGCCCMVCFCVFFNGVSGGERRGITVVMCRL